MANNEIPEPAMTRTSPVGGGVAVVTDSTGDLSIVAAEERGLRVVPLTVTFGEETFLSRVTITVEDFYARLEAADELPTTSQPSPAWFEEAYGDCADDGLDGVVSIHLSGALSGTVGVAERVAASAPLPVEVVDTHQVGGGLALAAIRAQQAADGGADLAEVAARGRAIASATQTFVVVDTLEYLRRGGRLSGTQALVGGVLRVKPVLTVREGRVEPLERARTWGRAMQRLVELAGSHAKGGPVDVVVSHGLVPDRAAELWAALEEQVEIRDRLETIIGPVVGAHTGPGAVGLSIVSAEIEG